MEKVMKAKKQAFRGDVTRHDGRNKKMVAGSDKIKNRKPNGTGYCGKTTRKK